VFVSCFVAELWGVSTPETDSGDDDSDNEESLSPDAVTSEAVAEKAPSAPPAAPEQQNNVEAADTDESNDDNFKVSDLRATWKEKDQTTKPSQLLNLDDFHMQQRQYRVGDKLKKGEAAEHLHSFRNHDAPAKQQKGKKGPEPEQTKAADRAAMAQYLFLQQSKMKDAKPTAGSAAPHRTKPLRSPRPELTLSESGEGDSVSSSSMGAASMWLKSPTGGNNVIVTDVDEFYAQQHAIHLENERKKRKILHISDNKEVAPDKTSSKPPPDYKRSMIPALADSADEEDSLAFALYMSMTASAALPADEDFLSRNLSEEYSKKQSGLETADDMEGEAVKEECVAGSESEALLSAKDDAVDGAAVVSAEMQPEEEKEVRPPEKAAEMEGADGAQQIINDSTVEDQDMLAEQTTSPSNTVAQGTIEESDEMNDESPSKAEDLKSTERGILDEVEDTKNDTAVEEQNEQSDEAAAFQVAVDDDDANGEKVLVKELAEDDEVARLYQKSTGEDANDEAVEELISSQNADDVCAASEVESLTAEIIIQDKNVEDEEIGSFQNNADTEIAEEADGVRSEDEDLTFEETFDSQNVHDESALGLQNEDIDGTNLEEQESFTEVVAQFAAAIEDSEVEDLPEPSIASGRYVETETTQKPSSSEELLLDPGCGSMMFDNQESALSPTSLKLYRAKRLGGPETMKSASRPILCSDSTARFVNCSKEDAVKRTSSSDKTTASGRKGSQEKSHDPTGKGSDEESNAIEPENDHEDTDAKRSGSEQTTRSPEQQGEITETSQNPSRDDSVVSADKDSGGDGDEVVSAPNDSEALGASYERAEKGKYNERATSEPNEDDEDTGANRSGSEQTTRLPEQREEIMETTQKPSGDDSFVSVGKDPSDGGDAVSAPKDSDSLGASHEPVWKDSDDRHDGPEASVLVQSVVQFGGAAVSTEEEGDDALTEDDFVIVQTEDAVGDDVQDVLGFTGPPGSARDVDEDALQSAPDAEDTTAPQAANSTDLEVKSVKSEECVYLEVVPDLDVEAVPSDEKAHVCDNPTAGLELAPGEMAVLVTGAEIALKKSVSRDASLLSEGLFEDMIEAEADVPVMTSEGDVAEGGNDDSSSPVHPLGEVTAPGASAMQPDDERGSNQDEAPEQPKGNNQEGEGRSEIVAEAAKLESRDTVTVESVDVLGKESRNLEVELPTRELVDHVPDDVSNVSTDNDDSTATVDGDDPSGVRAEDINLEAAGTDMSTTEVVDHVPDDVSTVSRNNEDSTASVDGDVAGSALATYYAEGTFEEPSAKPWDEGDELVLTDFSRDVTDGQEVIVPSDGPSGEAADATIACSADVSAGEPTKIHADLGIGGEEGNVDSSSPAESVQAALLEISLQDDVVDDEPTEDIPSRDDDIVQPSVSGDYKLDENPKKLSINEEVVPDELLASRDETTGLSKDDQDVSERATDRAIEGEAASDGDAVVDELLAGQREAAILPLLVDGNEGHDGEVPKEASVNADTGNEMSPRDESILDELLASRDETASQQSVGARNDGNLSTDASMDMESVLEDIIAGAVVEELFASSDDSSSQPPAENENERNSDFREVNSRQADGGDGTPADLVSEEAASAGEPFLESVVGIENDDHEDRKPGSQSGDIAARLMQNLLADESALDVFEETDGDTSGFHSVQHNNDPLLQADDNSELDDVSAIDFAPSKDTDEDFSPSEVIADFIAAGSRDERNEILPTGTDSSEELKPVLLSCAPSAGSTDKPAATSPGAKVGVDYKSVDYRGFVFVVHKSYGLMLLHCTRKKKKGPHFQLPGGHIDEPEFFAAAEQSRDAQNQLLLAARAGAARELYEETGMDVRYQLDRMEPAALRNAVEEDKGGKPILTNELKHRLYFFLPVTDTDFWSSVSFCLFFASFLHHRNTFSHCPCFSKPQDKGDSDAGKMHPMGAALGCEGSHLMVSQFKR